MLAWFFGLGRMTKIIVYITAIFGMVASAVQSLPRDQRAYLDSHFLRPRLLWLTSAWYQPRRRFLYLEGMTMAVQGSGTVARKDNPDPPMVDPDQVRRALRLRRSMRKRAFR